MINYQLSVKSCYKDMTYCSGTYIANGYDIYNGKQTTYRESTSSWTVSLQTDGTYLLKLPNGQPPSWGDIPYRLK